MYPAAAINGSTAAGISTGQGLSIMEDLARRELPRSMASEWTELAYLERTSGNTGMIVFAFSVVFVFLVLAALYESWALPIAVILVVPMCVLSSIAGIAYKDMDINIFTQIGFVVLIGLACKNAILIVEYARARRHEGMTIRAATIAACELRLRPIMMTSFAFILGVLPLVAAQGAGAEMRRALGTAVFSGMLGVTMFGIVLTPVFFYVVEHAAEFSIFARGAGHRVGAVLLDWLRLGPVWRMGRSALRISQAAFNAVDRRAHRRPESDSPSGDGPEEQERAPEEPVSVEK
jgi:multidrug efflux pump